MPVQAARRRRQQRTRPAGTARPTSRCTARWTLIWARAAPSRAACAWSSASPHYADSADVQTPFPGETNHMIGGNLSWRTERRRRRACLRHAGARLQRRRLQYRFGNPLRAARIRPRVVVESRDRPEIRAAPTARSSCRRTCSTCAARTCRYTCPSSCSRTIRWIMCSSRRMPAMARTTVWRRRPATGSAAAGRSPGSVSLLRTRYLGVTGLFASLGSDGRAQPFAPGYKLSAALEYHHPAGWFARLDASAIGSFYYYTSDAQAREPTISRTCARLQPRCVDCEPVGPQSLRCPLCAKGILFRPDSAEFSESGLPASRGSAAGRHHGQL